MPNARAIFVLMFASIVCMGTFAGSTRQAFADGPVQKQPFTAARGIPVEVFTSNSVERRSLALILAHGYDFSKSNMVPIAEAVARAGYVAVTFDFSGHGANPNDLDPGDPFPQTTADLGDMVEFTRHTLNLNQIALLGHSMGSNTILPYVMQHNDFVATIGVSGNVTDLQAELPRNLLLLVGTAEDELVQEDYRDAVQSAGAPRIMPSDFMNGRARLGVTIPDMTHTTILYAPQTANTIVRWLNASRGAAAMKMRASLKAVCWLTQRLSGVPWVGACG